MKNEKRIKCMEVGMILLLLLLLISTFIKNEKEIFAKKVLTYSIKKEDTKLVQVKNGNYEFLFVPISDNLERYDIFITQEISAETSGTIGYVIKDEETNIELITGIINIDSIKKSEILEIATSNYKLESEKKYQLILYSRISGEIFVEVDKDNQLYHKQIYQNSFYKFYILVDIIIMIIFISIFIFLIKCRNFKYRFFIVALITGILSIFIAPPYTAPDELRHFARAYTISEGVIVCKTYSEGEKYYYQELAECSIEKEFVNLKLISENSGEHWTSETNSLIFLPKYLDSIKKDYSGENTTMPYHGTDGINPIAYIPQLIFIWIAKLIHLNPIGVYYMARFGNLLCATVLLLLAIKQLPKYQNLLTILFFAPGLVFLRSTCSTDSILFGLIVLFLTYVGKVSETENLNFYQKKVWSKILIILIGIGLIKLPYILCATILLFIENKKFLTKKERKTWFQWIQKFILVGTMILIPCFIYKLSNIWLTLYSNHTGNTSIVFLRYLLENPIEVINLVIQTFYENFTEYLLSGLTIPHSKILLIPYLIVLIYFGLCQDKKERQKKNINESYFLFIGLGIWSAILGTFYFVGPSPDIGYIWGVQGRYLLPILPIIGFGLVSYKSTEEFEQRIKGERYFYYIVAILWIYIMATYRAYWIG